MKIFVKLVFVLALLSPAFAEAPGSPHPEYARKLDLFFGTLQRTKDPNEAQQAETEIRMIWASNSTDDAVHELTIATLAMQMKNFKSAETILDHLIQQHPEFSEAWNRRATLYFVVGRFSESLSDIEKVLELEPRHFGALSGKGACLRALGRDADALEAMKEAIAIDPFIGGLSDAIKEMKKSQQEL
ncbi:tetratricopeptide repeat protein [Aestuariivirga litoralis]|uniref:tetratricopeptide repeat protein n=1 Tax=Aestuariivirga litoralis TaxID=2650924 RepID=UPI0018C781FF|nr:tetratricopeptide repeat protein [Aestuariivirga litoralis]MBG1232449.1 tetratricopeptide repeat protein [Aestuariivirga litoralis]